MIAESGVEAAAVPSFAPVVVTRMRAALRRDSSESDATVVACAVVSLSRHE
jgi:hypothetical protein